MYEKIRTEEMNVGQIYKTAFSILGNNFKILVLSSLMIAIPMLLYIIFSDIAIISSILYIVYIFVAFSVIGGMTNLVSEISSGKNVGIEHVLEGSIYKLGSYILPTIVYYVTLIIGLILFIIPGIYLGVLFMFYPCAIIVTKKSGIKSLVESKKIVKGRWFNAFGLILSYFTILLVLIIATVIVLSLYTVSMTLVMGYSLFLILLLIVPILLYIVLVSSLLIFTSTLCAVWFINKYYLDNPVIETETVVIDEK